MNTYLRENAVPGTPVEFIGPAGSFYLRDIKRPLLLLAGGTGLAPFLSMLGKIAETGSAYPIHLVTASPTTPTSSVSTGWRNSRPNPRLHFSHLRGGRRQRPPAQGLCHGPCRASPPEWRRRRHLSVRPAADGGRSPRLARRAERDPGEFLLRKVLAERQSGNQQQPKEKL